MQISLAKYHGRYLGAMERDVDSFNRQAGLPVEVVEALHRLDRSREPQPQLYAEVLGFLAGIPEGLVPGFFARKLGACRNDTTRRMVLAQLPVENFCALRLLATWSTRNGAQGDVAALLRVLLGGSAHVEPRLEETLRRVLAHPQRFFGK